MFFCHATHSPPDDTMKVNNNGRKIQAGMFKSYFDDLCQLDIYSLCDTVIIKKWDTAHFEQFISSLI